MVDASIAALGTTPIPGAEPAGASVRYDDAFTLVEAEIQKMDSPAGGEVNWSEVAAGCRAILAEKSKDLLVAAWYARALVAGQRLAGLASGLALAKGILATFWDQAHPQPARMKSRRAALEWLAERCAGVIAPADAASPQGREALELCKRLLDELIGVIGTRFAPDDHGLGTLKRRLGELAAPAAPAAANGSASSAGAATVSPSGSAVAPALAAPAGPIASRADAIAKLQEIADFFARTEPHSPIGFLVQRAVAWNSKSFTDIFAELLKGKSDAQTQLWDSLGLKPPGAK